MNVLNYLNNIMQRSLFMVTGFMLAIGTIGGGVLATQVASAVSAHISCTSRVPVAGWGNYSLKYAPGKFCLANSVYRAIFQSDGNFVVYNGGRPVWSSSTNGKVGASGYLALQADGNIVVYNGSGHP